MAVLCLKSLNDIFQSTLPRGERRGLAAESFLSFPISIHAPARGATLSLLKSALIQKFQSTLPRGERRFARVVSGTDYEFQSTLPRGERPVRLIDNGCLYNFNPRSREGSDIFPHA